VPSLLQFRRDLKTALHVSVIVLSTVVSSWVTVQTVTFNAVTVLFVKCHLKLHIDIDIDIVRRGLEKEKRNTRDRVYECAINIDLYNKTITETTINKLTTDLLVTVGSQSALR